MTHFHRVVIKLGSSTLTAGSDCLNKPRLLELVRQMAHLHAAGCDVVVVSSGAVAAGREVLGFRTGSAPFRFPKDAGASERPIAFKQMLAAVGQVRLMQVWDQLFGLYGITVAQTLLTRTDLADRVSYLNARTTLLGLLEQRVIPIINENDVVAVDEIRIGDNDNLSALTAGLIDAQLLMLLTDTGGLYTADPHRDPSATLIREVHAITDEIMALASGAAGEQGTGGMATKIQAARLATEAGVTVAIADGGERDVILRLADGERVGTWFVPATDHLESRKRWILAGLVGRAEVHIDDGAARALHQGRSLLPAGIVRVVGTFDRGDAVAICTTNGVRLACGIANYGASDLDRIKGYHSDRIAAILGFTYGEEAIHRNNLVML